MQVASPEGRFLDAENCGVIQPSQPQTESREHESTRLRVEVIICLDSSASFPGFETSGLGDFDELIARDLAGHQELEFDFLRHGGVFRSKSGNVLAATCEQIFEEAFADADVWDSQ